MAVTTPIARCKYRTEHVHSVWRGVAKIIAEEAAKPNYSGPDPALVERVGTDMLAILVALDQWRAVVGPRNRKLPKKSMD
jgi:hypothetical protein